MEETRILMEVQSFLGFANFYRRFIKDYSRVTRPLTELTKKGRDNWTWNDEGEAAFEELKNRFTTAQILVHFDVQRPVIIETDESDFAISAVLSQQDDEERWHPVAFHSRKFQPTEINYEIHNKELLAIVDAFKQCRRYCEGATHQVQVFSDHQNLEYFTTTKVLNRRQARWAQELIGIDSASITVQVCKMVSQTCCQDVRSTVQKKGGVKTSQLRRFCRNITLQKRIDEEARSFASRDDWYR